MKKKNGVELYSYAKKIIPGGTTLFSKRSELYLPNKWPAYYSKSKNTFLWDLEGKKYLDMYCAVGTSILGYANNKINYDIQKVLKKGNMTSLNCPEEVLLAEKILKHHTWASMVKFTRGGGEANAVAIRIARSNTQKKNVAFCGYHGWHDWYLASNKNSKNNLDQHLMPGVRFDGIHENLKDTSFPFPYNNFDYLLKLVKKKNIGIIKMEVMRNVKPQKDFLKKIRNLCDKKKIILIFDECTSGYRQNMGGLHLKFRVNPDIAIYGKSLGSGFAINAIIGKKEIMKKAENTFISSTFWGERIGFVAALSSIRQFQNSNIFKKVISNGKNIKKNWDKISKKYDVPIKIMGTDAIPSFQFDKNHLKNKTFLTQEMLKNNILATNLVFVNIFHDPIMIKKYFNLMDKIFNIIKENKISKYFHSKTSEKPINRLN
jgi:glutamate-1-semialdehyde 2,1-aminomutase